MSAVLDHLAGLAPTSVLCIATTLPDVGWTVQPQTLDGDSAVFAQLPRRFDAVFVSHLEPVERWRAVLHTAVLHLDRDGHLAIVGRAEPFPGDDLVPVASDATIALFRRGPRFTVHDLLHEARSRIGRVTPFELSEQLQAERPPLVIDTRTPTDRDRFGTIPGSVHVPRTVVEWHFDPANGYLHPAMTSFDQPLVVVCNAGYSSSLSAANLARIGFTDVGDLVGGFEAWRAAGLPVDHPDHSHLDLPSGPDRNPA